MAKLAAAFVALVLVVGLLRLFPQLGNGWLDMYKLPRR